MGTSSASKMPQPGNDSTIQPPTSPLASSALNQHSVIGKAIAIKGEITASDPVYVYGCIEGSIHAPEHRVTVGKEGRVKADISAREVVVMGDVCGNLDGAERVEIRCEGSVMGDLATRRIYVEDGAVLSGTIEVRKPNKKEKSEAQQERQMEPGDTELERRSVVSFPVSELTAEIAS